jgi:methionyl-tRNA formyltransferase
MRVLIIGRTEILYNSVLELSKFHEICGIITSKASPEYARNEIDFQQLSLELNCPFLNCKFLDKEAIEFVDSCKPDIAISVNWVSVIKNEIFNLIPLGILNCHPGNLPEYRGNAVCNWAMIREENEIIVTVHFMEPGELDSGDIMVQEVFPITDETTITEFLNFWMEITPVLFLRALDGLENFSLVPRKQSEILIEPFRCFPRLAIDSKIDWNNSAMEINRLIHASSKPYSGAYSYQKIGGDIKKLTIWSSRLVLKETLDIGSPGHVIYNDKDTGESYVYTGKGIIAINNCNYDNEPIFLPGKKWSSIRMRLGIDVEQELINLKNLINDKF